MAKAKIKAGRPKKAANASQYEGAVYLLKESLDVLEDNCSCGSCGLCGLIDQIREFLGLDPRDTGGDEYGYLDEDRDDFEE